MLRGMAIVFAMLLQFSGACFAATSFHLEDQRLAAVATIVIPGEPRVAAGEAR